MWTVVQVGICLIVLLLVCFVVGKKIGERRISKVHEEMKALEKSFNQLLEQMELVSGHNLKVLEAKTEELRDMLHAADKKCLYANDLLQELENTRRDLQSRLTSLPAAPASLHEKKLRIEIQEMLEEVHTKVRLLERRLEDLEQVSRLALPLSIPEPLRAMAFGAGASTPEGPSQPRNGSAPEDSAGNHAPPWRTADPGASRPALWPPPLLGGGSPRNTHPRTPIGEGSAFRFPVTTGQGGAENVIPFKQREEPAVVPSRGTSPAGPFADQSFASPPEGQRTPDLHEPTEEGPLAEMAAPPAELSSRSIPSPMPVAPGPAPCPETGLPLPEPGTPFHDVLKLAGQGVSIPQIARILSMGKGEIELIMNIYGARLHMRKVQ